MTVLELFDLTVRFGLPLVMFFGVIYLSLSGAVIWRPSHNAIVDAYKARLEDVTRERDRAMDIAYPLARGVEQGATALRESREHR